jgi:hypothetical protein
VTRAPLINRTLSARSSTTWPFSTKNRNHAATWRVSGSFQE